jgi:hypothetical protein
MKFRVRPGFTLFHSMDEAADFKAGNRAVRPRAVAGQVARLTREEVSILVGRGELGRLEPIDGEAVSAYGDTKPLESLSMTRPELFVARPPEAR